MADYTLGLTAAEIDAVLQGVNDGSILPFENRLKGLQQWNILGEDATPVLTDAYTLYTAGDLIASGGNSVVEVVTTAYYKRDSTTGIITGSTDAVGSTPAGELKVTLTNTNNDISSTSEYIGAVLSDSSQGEADITSGLTKAGVAGADITCNINLATISSGFKWFFIMPKRGHSYAVTDEEASVSVGGLGQGQSWVDLTASRALGVTYTNNTGRPIQLMITCNVNSPLSGNTQRFEINGVDFARTRTGAEESTSFFMPIIPDGDTYLLTNASGDASLLIWAELR